MILIIKINKYKLGENKLKRYLHIAFVVIGILLITISLNAPGGNYSAELTAMVNYRVLMLGIMLIIYGSARLLGFFPFMNLSSQEEAGKCGYRETNSELNCTKCRDYDLKYGESSKAKCKLFKIIVDENHICDLYG